MLFVLKEAWGDGFTANLPPGSRTFHGCYQNTKLLSVVCQNHIQSKPAQACRKWIFLGCISLDHLVGCQMVILQKPTLIFIIVIPSLPHRQWSVGFMSFPLHSTDDFLSCHDSLFQDILWEVLSWLETHPQEVVILACRNFDGLTKKLHCHLIACIKEIFQCKLCPRNVSMRSPFSSFLRMIYYSEIFDSKFRYILLSLYF